QPIVGCQLAVDFADGFEIRGRGGVGQAPLADLVLIAADAEGYRSLGRLVSRSFTEHDASTRPHVPFQWLADAPGGMIVLSGGLRGPLDQVIAAGQGERAAPRLERLKQAFGRNLYVELQRHERPEERRTEPELIDLAY